MRRMAGVMLVSLLIPILPYSLVIFRINTPIQGEHMATSRQIVSMTFDEADGMSPVQITVHTHNNVIKTQ